MSQLRRDRLAALVQNEELLATPLLVLCIDTFTADFFNWEPQTFDAECLANFGVRMPDTNRDKVWALVTAISTNLFYVSLESFIPIANSLNDSEADFDDYDPVTSEEAAWAITEVLLSDPPQKSPAKLFSHDIKRYIGVMLQTEGVTTPPPSLAPFAEYDRDPEENVGISVGPDPDFLKMHEDRQADERAEIENYVAGRKQELMRQLQMLPLVRGSTAKLDPSLPLAAAAPPG